MYFWMYWPSANPGFLREVDAPERGVVALTGLEIACTQHTALLHEQLALERLEFAASRSSAGRRNHSMASSRLRSRICIEARAAQNGDRDRAVAIVVEAVGVAAGFDVDLDLDRDDLTALEVVDGCEIPLPSYRDSRYNVFRKESGRARTLC